MNRRTSSLAAALVEFFRYVPIQTNRAPSYGAVILSSSEPTRWIPLGSAKSIDTTVAEFETAIQDTAPTLQNGTGQASGPTNTIPTILAKLYDKIWKPIDPQLPPGAKSIILSPDDALNFLSFATLLGPDKKFLAERYSIRYVTSGRDLLKERKPSTNRLAVFFGNAAFSHERSRERERNPAKNFPVVLAKAERGDLSAIQLPELPGAERECALLSERAKSLGWKVSVFSGAEASEAQLYAVNSPGILHLATHGFFLPDNNPGGTSRTNGTRGIGGINEMISPGNNTFGLLSPSFAGRNPLRRSGLALAGAATTLEAWKRGEVPPTENDGIVTASEVALLNLQGTWLVTLSACHTGIGEIRSGEGVLGLRRSFISAGAENLLMTLWSVADEETARFMLDFYEAAHRTGDAGQALADVQRNWLVRLRRERGLEASVRLAGPFILNSAAF